MRRRLAVASVLLAVAGGCAHSRPPPPLQLTADDSAVLVADVVAFAKRELPPASTTLVFDGAADALTEELEDAFTKAGYAIAAPAATGGRRVRAIVRELDHGLLLQVGIGELEVSRWYPRAGPAAKLGTDAPLVVRRAS